MSDHPTEVAQSVAWRELFVPQYSVSLVLITLAVLLHAADATQVATLSPAIVRDIGGIHLMGWTLSLYELGSITAAAASGLLSVRLGLRHSLSLAAAIFALGCAVSAIAPTMQWLLLGRLVQGVGGGGMVALSFVAVNVLFPERLMPRALAIVSMMWGMSAFLGPLIGGLIVEFASWRWGFGLFAALAVVLCLWNMLRISSPDDSGAVSKQSPFPVWRLTFLAFGVLCISSAGIKVHSLATPLWLFCGVFFLFIFFRLDSRHQQTRLLPRDAVSLNNPVGAGLIMILCFAMATIAISVYGPLLMTELHGLSELQAGYVVACSSIGWSLAAVVFSGSPSRRDRHLILMGMLSLTISIFGFVYAVQRGPVWLIAFFATLEGAGFGMAWAFILRRANSLIEEGDAERLASAIATLHRLGYALGAAIIGIVANAAGLRLLPGATASDPVSIYGAVEAANWIFMGSLPFAVMGLYATWRFLAPSTR